MIDWAWWVEPVLFFPPDFFLHTQKHLAPWSMRKFGNLTGQMGAVSRSFWYGKLMFTHKSIGGGRNMTWCFHFHQSPFPTRSWGMYSVTGHMQTLAMHEVEACHWLNPPCNNLSIKDEFTLFIQIPILLRFPGESLLSFWIQEELLQGFLSQYLESRKIYPGALLPTWIVCNVNMDK